MTLLSAELNLISPTGIGEATRGPISCTLAISGCALRIARLGDNLTDHYREGINILIIYNRICSSMQYRDFNLKLRFPCHVSRNDVVVIAPTKTTIDSMDPIQSNTDDNDEEMDKKQSTRPGLKVIIILC